MANTVVELTWLGYILQDLRVTVPALPQLFCDNLSALHMTINPVFHAWNKHIELDHHFVREQVAPGGLMTHFVPLGLQIADIHQVSSQGRIVGTTTQTSPLFPAQFAWGNDIEDILE